MAGEGEDEVAATVTEETEPANKDGTGSLLLSVWEREWDFTELHGLFVYVCAEEDNLAQRLREEDEDEQDNGAQYAEKELNFYKYLHEFANQAVPSPSPLFVAVIDASVSEDAWCIHYWDRSHQLCVWVFSVGGRSLCGAAA